MKKFKDILRDKIEEQAISHKERDLRHLNLEDRDLSDSNFQDTNLNAVKVNHVDLSESKLIKRI